MGRGLKEIIQKQFKQTFSIQEDQAIIRLTIKLEADKHGCNIKYNLDFRRYISNVLPKREWTSKPILISAILCSSSWENIRKCNKTAIIWKQITMWNAEESVRWKMHGWSGVSNERQLISHIQRCVREHVRAMEWWAAVELTIIDRFYRSASPIAIISRLIAGYPLTTDCTYLL